MMTQKASSNSSSGYFEPEMTNVFLPGCRNCGGSHPLARKPVPTVIDKCPDCDAPQASPGAPITEKAVLTGYSPSVLIARAFLGIGKALHKLSKKDFM